MFLGPPSSASPNLTVARQWTQPAVSLSPSNCPWKVDSERQGLEAGLGQKGSWRAGPGLLLPGAHPQG